MLVVNFQVNKEKKWHRVRFGEFGECFTNIILYQNWLYNFLQNGTDSISQLFKCLYIIPLLYKLLNCAYTPN